MKITEKEFNVVTGEETITERNETKEEKLKREQQEAEYVAAQAEAQTKAQVKAVLLERLGLTQDEFNTLIA